MTGTLDDERQLPGQVNLDMRVISTWNVREVLLSLTASCVPVLSPWADPDE